VVRVYYTQGTRSIVWKYRSVCERSYTVDICSRTDRESSLVSCDEEVQIHL